MRKIIRFCLVFLLLPSLAFADVDKDARPYIHPQKKSNALKFSGYLDTSYNYLLQRNTFISGIDDRVYDLEPNGFTLQQATANIALQPKEGFGGLASLVVGRDANKLAPFGWNPYFGSQTLAFTPPQLYLQYAFHQFILKAGQFPALAGNESYDPTLNTNFSHSILNGYAEPGRFLGLRGIYTINPVWLIVVGLNNGWDSIRDTGRPKTIELGMAYAPNPFFSLSAQAYSGGERLLLRLANGPIGTRRILNIILHYKLTPKLRFIIDADYALQTKAALPSGTGRAVWQGIAGYANYQINDLWQISFRAETFADKNGYQTGVKQNWREITLTLGYKPIKSIELRAEARRDFSNKAVFVAKDNRHQFRNQQQSYALEGLYKF